MPHITVRNANLIILWHLLITKITENVALGFLAAHMNETLSQYGYNPVSNGLAGGPGATTAMPTIYEHEDDENDTCASESALLSSRATNTLQRSLSMRSTPDAGPAGGLNVRRSQSALTSRWSQRQASPRVQTVTDANNNDTLQSATQKMAITNSWLSRLSARLNPFRSRPGKLSQKQVDEEDDRRCSHSQLVVIIEPELREDILDGKEDVQDGVMEDQNNNQIHDISPDKRVTLHTMEEWDIE